jgi:hypothetical protein
MVVGADGQIGVPGADANEGDAQLVAQEPQQVEELAAGLAASGQHVVQLVDHQHPHPRLAEQP